MPKPDVVLLLAALGLSALSCRGPEPEAAPQPGGPDLAAPADAAPTAGDDRTRAGRVDLLERLVAVNREAVTVGEQRLAQMQDLANAGRLGQHDLKQAEIELLGLRARLIQREQELADARAAAGAR